ncbi:MAG TPA: bi-domain-containing oxidoreductase [Longimicrobiales bacterium]
MKQVLQSLKTGETEVAEVPVPAVRRGELLIATSRTLVSSGTERMLVEFGKANLLDKARQQPDKVRLVLDKMKTDGVLPTLEAVFNKLDQPLPLGYCNVGRIIAVGSGVSGFEVGDRVISNGKHAEVVSVPANLCARVPDGVPDDEAAFTVLAAIALQGIRLAEPTLGESVVVTGLGLIGLVTVQLLRAQGCRVLGLDYDRARLEQARGYGAEVVDLGAGQDPVAAAAQFSRGRGVDAVLITASTQSSEPVHQAALMCRKRGRIVLVGVAGLELSRADFYEKELTLQVSCSYGPGRYDPTYEEKGVDYPIGFVRWTEQRNFEAVLDMMSDRRLDVRPLVTHRFPIERAADAYALVASADASLGILLEYPQTERFAEGAPRTVALRPAQPSTGAVGDAAGIGVSFVGSGNYATAVLIPAFKAAGVRMRSVVSAAGVSGLHAGRKFGFETTTTDAAGVFADAATNAVVITTRHDSHARYVLDALAARRHVYVEKPLCLTLEELDAIERAYSAIDAGSRPVLMVGFNRRFAPHVLRLKELASAVPGPKALSMMVNAGSLPADHWTQDPEVGGGRIIGEACHFIDLLRFVAGAPIVEARALGMKSRTADTVSVQLAFADGSVGSIDYFANGSKAFPKERLEVFAEGRVLQLDNFRRLTGYGWPGFRRMSLWRQDKGHRASAAAFVRAVAQSAPAPIPFDEIVEVSRVSIEVAEGVR